MDYELNQCMDDKCMNYELWIEAMYELWIESRNGLWIEAMYGLRIG